MKELTIEQKANRYDEVVNEIKRLRDILLKEGVINENGIICDNFNRIFPEFNETDDEKIRKIISDILLIDSDEIREILDANNVLMQDINAWLEKQGEQKQEWGEEDENECNHILKILNLVAEEQETKGYNNLISSANWLKSIKDRIQSKPRKKNIEQNLAKKYGITGIGSKHAEGKLAEMLKKKIETENVDNTNKVEPKFHVGDWIASFDYFEPIQVVGIRTREYELSSGMIDPIYMVDNNPDLRLWTIDDIKDGDVLATEPIEGYYSPFVAICKERDLDSFNSHCFIGFDGKFYEGEEGHTIGDMHPATKKQRDLLFEKMEEAGYMWDSKNKELQEIVNMVDPKFKVGDWVVKKNGDKFCDGRRYVQITANDGEDIWFDSGSWLKSIKIRHWTIQDAEDGDIIYAKSKFSNFSYICIFFKTENGNSWDYCNVFSENLERWVFDNDEGFLRLNRFDFYPASKEQRDLLFQKMKEAGYEWDSKQKKLKQLKKK